MNDDGLMATYVVIWVMPWIMMMIMVIIDCWWLIHDHNRWSSWLRIALDDHGWWGFIYDDHDWLWFWMMIGGSWLKILNIDDWWSWGRLIMEIDCWSWKLIVLIMIGNLADYWPWMLTNNDDHWWSWMVTYHDWLIDWSIDRLIDYMSDIISVNSWALFRPTGLLFCFVLLS